MGRSCGVAPVRRSQGYRPRVQERHHGRGCPRRDEPTASVLICCHGMFKRQTTGSVVCASCGSLVGVNDEKCYSCGRRNPGLWGFGPSLRRFGNDLGFVGLVVYGCGVMYVATLLMSMAIGEGVAMQSLLDRKSVV